MSNGCRARSARTFVLAWILALCVSACGGGGGDGTSNGGGSGSGGSLRFTLDRSSIAFDYIDTQQTAVEIVTATAQGDLPTTLYIGAQDE